MRRFTFLLALGIVLVLAACGGPAPERFGAALSGQSEVPPVTTNADGNVDATLTGNTLTVTGSVTNLSSALREVQGSAAHIHRGQAGENGPIVFPLTVQPLVGANSANLSGTFTLSDEQINILRNGGYYVNVHTENYPGGEVRGQLRLLLR